MDFMDRRGTVSEFYDAIESQAELFRNTDFYWRYTDTSELKNHGK